MTTNRELTKQAIRRNKGEYRKLHYNYIKRLTVGHDVEFRLRRFMNLHGLKVPDEAVATLLNMIDEQLGEPMVSPEELEEFVGHPHKSVQE